MSEAKKVVHITTVHHPFDTRIYHKECLSLQKAGYDVSLITTVDDPGVHQNSEIKLLPIKKRRNRFSRMIFSTLEAWKKAKKVKANCYHIHDPELLPVGWLLKNKRNVVIYDIHEDYETAMNQKEYIPKPIRKLIASMYRLVERLLTHRMDLCLAEKYYQEKYPTGTCILNYPKLNDTFVNRQIDGKPVDKLLYTGNVSIERGALIHAKIPQIDPAIQVHFIGKCPRDLANAIYHEAGDKRDHIMIEGIDTFIERGQIDAKYVEQKWLAGIAIFPPTAHYMKKELTKFFEYMSAGIPVICSNFPVWQDFIDTYKCGIAVDPFNDLEIYQAIDYLKTNPDEAIKMGVNGKRAVMEQLNWKTEEKKLIIWYEELLKSLNG